MEELSLSPLVYFIIFIIAFIAETYGAIVGGGGFLSQPALIAFGVPAHFAVANTVAGALGSKFGGYYVFQKKNLIRWNIVKYCLPGLILGTIFGLYLLNIVSARFLERFLAAMSLLAVTYMLFGKKFTTTHSKPFPKYYKLGFLIYAFLLGIYIALSGAGSALFSTIVLTTIFGTTFIESIALRKVIHAIPIVCGIFGYYYLGLINWPLFAVLFGGSALGGFVGSKASLLIGDKRLKPIFITAILFFASYLLFKPN